MPARIVCEFALHFLGDQRDGGKRRAKFMRGGGGQPVERRKMLLTLQHQFCCCERIGEHAGLLRHAPGIDAGEGNARHHRDPDAGHIDERHRQFGSAKPGQRHVEEDEQRGQRHHQRAEKHRHTQRQRRRRYDHRHGEQKRERIGQAAGQKQKSGKLEGIEHHNAERREGPQPMRRRITEGEEQVEPGRQRDQREADRDGQRELEPVGDDEHGGALADDGQPSQLDQRVEAQPVALLRVRGTKFQHGRFIAEGRPRAKRYLMRGLARLVAAAATGSSGQTCLG